MDKEQKLKILNNGKKKKKKCISVIDEIRNGKSETKACEMYGINKSRFRRMILDHANDGITKSKKLLDIKDRLLLTTDNEKIYAFLMQVGLTKHAVKWTLEFNENGLVTVKLPKNTVIPDDMEETVERVMTETLSEKELSILKLRACEYNTLEDVGKLYDVTRERIRQIEAKILRKLCNPKLSARLILGDKVVNNLEAELQKHITDGNKLIEHHIKTISNTEYEPDFTNIMSVNGYTFKFS